MSKNETVDEKAKIMQAMEAAAAKADAELDACKTAADVAAWFKRNYMAAGYKRLARGLMAHFPAK